MQAPNRDATPVAGRGVQVGMWCVMWWTACFLSQDSRAAGARGMAGLIRKAQRNVDRWAVVIGISRYRELKPAKQLKYAAADAQAFYEFLRSEEGGAFPEDHVRLLLNERATLRAMKSALGTFLLNAAKDDLVIIYFAGHGDAEPGRTDAVYLLPFDVDPKDLFATAYALADLRALLARRVYARRVLLVVDACHSGAIATGGFLTRSATGVFHRYMAALASSESGRAVWTASSPNELSQEGRKWGGGHGVFTYYLLEGMRGRADGVVDGRRDGIVSLHEAFKYTFDKVSRETKNAQHPTLAGGFQLPLAVCDAKRAMAALSKPARPAEPAAAAGAPAAPALPRRIKPGETFTIQVTTPSKGSLLATLDRARQAMRREVRRRLSASGFAMNAAAAEKVYKTGVEVDFEQLDGSAKLTMKFAAPKSYKPSSGD